MILRRIINNFYSQDVISENDHIEFINKIIKTNNLYYLLNYYVKLRSSNLIDIVNTIIYGNHNKIVQILIDHKIKNYKIFLSCFILNIIIILLIVLYLLYFTFTGPYVRTILTE